MSNLYFLYLSMKKLYRYPRKGYIGGVCHGMGEHTNIDPIIWRIVTVFGGLGLVYLIFWIVLKKGEVQNPTTKL